MGHKFVAAAEIEGLFGDQMRHDQFFVKKLEIQHQADLTAEQHRLAIETAEQTLLNDAQRTARKETVLHPDASAQTEAMNAQALSAESRFVERAQNYGAEPLHGKRRLMTSRNAGTPVWMSMPGRIVTREQLRST